MLDLTTSAKNLVNEKRLFKNVSLVEMEKINDVQYSLVDE